MIQLVDLVLVRGRVYQHSVHKGNKICPAQHSWPTIGGALAWLAGVCARPVGKLDKDGVSGRYEIEVQAVSIREDDLQHHIEDSMRIGEL